MTHYVLLIVFDSYFDANALGDLSDDSGKSFHDQE